MRYAALALALCLVFAPLEAATSKAPAGTHLVKVKAKKNKFNGHKAPKRNKRPRTRTIRTR